MFLSPWLEWLSFQVSAIDSQEGFLAEWWAVFYDVYFSMRLQHEEAVERALKKVTCDEDVKCYISFCCSV